MKHRGPSNEPSQRQLRVGEEVRHALASVFERGDLQDPDLYDRSITVTEVSVSPDLKKATAFVLPLGGEDADSVIDALNRAAPYLRHETGRRVKLKFTPQLIFKADYAFDQADRMTALLQNPDGG